MTALKDWSNFCISLAMMKPEYTSGIRKMVPNIMFETPLDQSLKLTHVGFKENGSKLSMLKKYYFNEQSIKKAKLALEKIQKKKDHGSVAFSTIGEEKKFTHHQHCIQAVAIKSYPSGQIEYTVFYRASETIKIFMGDMVFIRDIIMPIFGKGKVAFIFSSANLNAMYCPIMFIHDDNWIKMLKDLYKRDKPFFKRFKKWTEMYFSNEPINYSSAEVIRQHIHTNLTRSKRKAILMEFNRIESGSSI